MEFTGDDRPQVRNASLMHLAELGHPDHDELYFAALEHEDWSTRETALGILERMRSREATGAIVAQVGEETGLMLIKFTDALWRLTGQPHGGRGDRWQKWWQDEGDSFEPISPEKLAALPWMTDDELARIVRLSEDPEHREVGSRIPAPAQVDAGA